MNISPKVSIIMGVYNCESTVAESIESILNQTYTNWELIIRDDCSTDNTYEIVKAYADKYPEKIKFKKNKQNITLAPTLNKCLSDVSGKYIARQDGDDLSHKDRLKEQVEFLENNPNIDLVGTNMVSFDENGEKGIHKSVPYPTKKDYIKHCAIFSHATILVKSDVMKDLNGYCEEWYAVQAEDCELWSRFIEKGYVGHNMDCNLYYVREDNNTYKRKNIKRRLRGIVLLIKVFKRLRVPLYSYLYVFKDIIAIFIPKKVFIQYYRKRMKNIT